jgi:Uma2 family endonuclease
MLALLRDDGYAEAHPTASDLFLLVEVSDASLAYDRQVKLPLYAREGVPEVWLVEINPARISVHRSPSLGIYQEIQIKPCGDRIDLLAFPDVELAVEDILG